MASTEIGVVGANALFMIACGTVGVRLLLLSRRTHGLPEFYLGVGFVGMVASIGCLAASGVGRTSSGEVDLVLLSVGLVVFWLAVGTQASFTSAVFRPSAGWAETLVFAIAAASAVTVGGVLHSLGAAEPHRSSFDASSDWMLLLRLPLGAVYLWTAAEACIQFRMSKRRERLGISDPVVTNRLALCAMYAFVAASSVVISTTLHAQGRGPLADPRAAVLLGLGGMAGAVLLYLAFMPPRWYLRRISGHRTVAPG